MMNNSIKAVGTTIFIEPGSHKIEFPYPVAETIISNGILIIRLEPSTGNIFNENVFGVSLTGDFLWQIKPIKHVYQDSPYTSLKQEVNGIKLSNWDGDDVIISPETGDILRKRYSK